MSVPTPGTPHSWKPSDIVAVTLALLSGLSGLNAIAGDVGLAALLNTAFGPGVGPKIMADVALVSGLATIITRILANLKGTKA